MSINIATDKSGTPIMAPRFANSNEFAAILTVSPAPMIPVMTNGAQVTLNGVPQFKAGRMTLAERIGHGELLSARGQIVLSERVPAKVNYGEDGQPSTVTVLVKITSGQLPAEACQEEALVATSGYFQLSTIKGSRGANLSTGAFVLVDLPFEAAKRGNIANGMTVKFRDGLADTPGQVGHATYTGKLWFERPAPRKEGAPAKAERVPDDQA